MNSNKLALLKNKLLFTTYLIFSFFNILIHFLNYYKGFVSMPMEYALYAVKLTICMAICIIVKDEYSVDRPDGSYILHFAHIKSIMKMMICFDLFEIFISVNMTEFEGVAANLIIIATIAKIVLDYYFYTELVRTKVSLRVWQCSNIAAVIFIASLLSDYDESLQSAILLVVVRFFFALMIIIYCHKEDMIEKKDYLIRKLFAIRLSARKLGIIWGVAAVFLIVFLWLRYSTGTLDKELQTNDGSVSIMVSDVCGYAGKGDQLLYQYSVSNKMPKGSGFHQEKYGLFSLKQEKLQMLYIKAS